MSRYRGPYFKKIRRLGALPGLTKKSLIDGSDLRKQLGSVKKSQYRIRLEEKQTPLIAFGPKSLGLQRYKELQDIITILGLDENPAGAWKVLILLFRSKSKF